MNSYFEKVEDFKGIMADRLDRIVASKNSVLFIILSKLVKSMYFFLISSNYKNTRVTFNVFMRQTKSMENIMRLLFEEAFVSDRQMSGGQLYSFFQLLFNTDKISLN